MHVQISDFQMLASLDMGTDHFCLSLHRELLDLVKRCAQYGESNSVLLIGPRGSGKSLVGSFLCIIRFIIMCYDFVIVWFILFTSKTKVSVLK